MSKVNEVSQKLEKMPLPDLIEVIAEALNSDLDEKRIDFLLIHLEMALQKRRVAKTLGIKVE